MNNSLANSLAPFVVLGIEAIMDPTQELSQTTKV